MDRTERFYKIQRMLQGSRAVPRQAFLDTLEISPATFKRDLEYMRERMGAPIVWDREGGGYRFDASDPAASTWALPGLWFSEQELRALLTVEHLLESMQPGLLGPQIGPRYLKLDNTHDFRNYAYWADNKRQDPGVKMGQSKELDKHFKRL